LGEELGDALFFFLPLRGMAVEFHLTGLGVDSTLGLDL
jgi:hypothetical protein